MTRFCLAAGLILTSHCEVQPKLTATDRGRCWGDKGRIKAPKPIEQENSHGL